MSTARFESLGNTYPEQARPEVIDVPERLMVDDSDEDLLWIDIVADNELRLGDNQIKLGEQQLKVLNALAYAEAPLSINDLVYACYGGDSRRLYAFMKSYLDWLFSDFQRLDRSTCFITSGTSGYIRPSGGKRYSLVSRLRFRDKRVTEKTNEPEPDLYQHDPVTSIRFFTAEPPPRALTRGALCAQVDPELFFPNKGENEKSAQAKKVCGKCAVRAICLDWTMDVEAAIGGTRYGVSGGLTADERTRLARKTRAADNSPGEQTEHVS